MTFFRLSILCFTLFFLLFPSLSFSTEEIAMVLVKGGCFQMGDIFGDGSRHEKPAHKVCVDDFKIGIYEVTQLQRKDVMGSNPSFNKNCDSCPVESVSWDDVQIYIKKLNSTTGKKYRLPTEAEWEYAARSGGKQEKYAGFNKESQFHEYGNFCDSNCVYEHKDKKQDDGYKKTSPVGSYKPNSLGLYDMSGNVYEWVNDRYEKDYYSKSPESNPPGPLTGDKRVLRGGSWDNFAFVSRTLARYKDSPHVRYFFDGFRLAEDVI